MIERDRDTALERLKLNEAVTLSGARTDAVFMDIYELWMIELSFMRENAEGDAQAMSEMVRKAH
ncbi:hypothetical protein P7F60_12055 [Rhizobium sp. YJ-22]|uniref:hypothetical protein n=1 Tax=Rhizobium sp. YJ-22 TaxID=3037556 RepID=UPI002412C5E1|nr:hypothetical protein [Rhizobium sp. YJ-22]MDG3577126.1 hypothetical protein [Rhizobium sp. YJ-22]